MLVNLKEILDIIPRGKGAVPAFNTPNLESIMAVIQAAEQMDFPVIISHAELHESVTPVDIIAPIMIDMAKKAKVPVCVHLDHGENVEYCIKAIDLGFTSVMYDGSVLPYDENVKNTIEVAKYAHSKNVSIEAELGKLKNRECGEGNGGEEYTDPKLAKDFVEKTMVDALAISFGTAHGYYETKPVLNFDVISKVYAEIDTPLVMHGGSGLTEDDYREVIKRGVQKINYYSYMAYIGTEAVAEFVKDKKNVFYHDVANVAVEAMKKNAIEKISLFKGV